MKILIMMASSRPLIFLIQALWFTWLHGEVYGLQGTPCYKQMADIAFLLDSSVSIYEEDFTKELEFVKQIVKPLSVGRFGVQVSVSTFSSDTVTHIYLDDFDSKDALIRAIDDIRYREGQTNTDIAIAHAREVIFRKENGDRDGVERLIIVVTDGYSTNNTSTVRQAKICRDLGIKMISVGVGHGINETELRNIASTYNGEKMVFTVDDFDGLDDIVDLVTVAACDVMLQDSAIDKYCGGKPADVYLAVDSSSSMLDSEYEQILRFLSNVINMFDIGPEATRVGVVAYSEHVHPILRLDTSYDKSIINKRLMEIPIYGGKTKTGSALHYLRRNAFKRDYSRMNVAHVVILITDGQSTDAERALREAELLKKLGAYIFVVGIGSSIDLNELRFIASKPQENFVFLKEDVSMLSEIRNVLAIRTCTEFSSMTTPQIQLDTVQGNKLCTDSEPKYALFVYDELSFPSKSNNIINDFVDRLMYKRTGNTLKYDWMTKSRDGNQNREYSQNSALAYLLKDIRIHGFGNTSFTRNVREITLVMFIENSIQNDFSKMIVELGRLNFVHKPNIVLIYIGHVDKEQPVNDRRLYGLNAAHVIKVSSVKDLHDIKQTLVDQICSASLITQ